MIIQYMIYLFFKLCTECPHRTVILPLFVKQNLNHAQQKRDGQWEMATNSRQITSKSKYTHFQESMA